MAQPVPWRIFGDTPPCTVRGCANPIQHRRPIEEAQDGGSLQYHRNYFSRVGMYFVSGEYGIGTYQGVADLVFRCVLLCRTLVAIVFPFWVCPDTLILTRLK